MTEKKLAENIDRLAWHADEIYAALNITVAALRPTAGDEERQSAWEFGSRILRKVGGPNEDTDEESIWPADSQFGVGA